MQQYRSVIHRRETDGWNTDLTDVSTVSPTRENTTIKFEIPKRKKSIFFIMLYVVFIKLVVC